MEKQRNRMRKICAIDCPFSTGSFHTFKIFFSVSPDEEQNFKLSLLNDKKMTSEIHLLNIFAA
jgi:hypothetical protein